MNKADATNNGKSKINSIEWYVAHYTPSIPQQALLSRQVLSKTSTEVQYVERSVFMKEVSTQKMWTFELGTGERINAPIWIFIGFHQMIRFHFWEKLCNQILRNFEMLVKHIYDLYDFQDRKLLNLTEPKNKCDRHNLH